MLEGIGSHMYVKCIDSIQKWMASNRLMLNPAKSEFIWCASPRRVHLIDRSDFVLNDGTVAVSTVVRNLGNFFYEPMSMIDHVNQLIRSCFYQLRRIKSIRWLLPTSTVIQLVNSFVSSRVEYCNSLLAGLPKCQLDRIQCVLNVAVRLIYGRGRYEHVISLLRDRLHWLRVPQRVEFKRCLLVYKALHGLAPAYITEYCVFNTNERRSSLRSSAQNRLLIPRPSKTVRLGERSFSVNGSSLWNSLLDSVKSSTSVDVFKSRLKT